MARRPLSEVSPLVADILNGDHDDILDYIDQAVQARKKRMYRPGAKVRLVGTRNAEIDGQIGTVVKVNAKRITVGLGEKSEWGYEREYLVPISMLEVV